MYQKYNHILTIQSSLPSFLPFFLPSSLPNDPWIVHWKRKGESTRMTHVYQDHVTKARLLYGDLYGIPLTRVAWNYASRIFPPAGWQYGRGARPRMPFVEKPRNYPSANLSGSCVIQVWSLPPSLAPTHPLLVFQPRFHLAFEPRDSSSSSSLLARSSPGTDVLIGQPACLEASMIVPRDDPRTMLLRVIF